MKNKLLTMMLIIASAFLTNCSKKDNNSNPVATAGTCPVAGYVYTTQGCLPQGTCPVGYGQSGNQCLAVTQSNIGQCQTVGYVYTSMGCLPQGTCPAGYGQSGNQCYAVSNTSTGGSCQAGYVYTQYGCMPQTSSCPANYGYYNGSCYPATQSTGVGGIGGVGGTCQAGYVGTAMGCLPQNNCPAGYGYSYGNYNGQTGGWCYPQTY